METVIVKPDVEMDSNMNIVTDTVSQGPPVPQMVKTSSPENIKCRGKRRRFPSGRDPWRQVPGLEYDLELMVLDNLETSGEDLEVEDEVNIKRARNEFYEMDSFVCENGYLSEDENCITPDSKSKETRDKIIKLNSQSEKRRKKVGLEVLTEPLVEGIVYSSGSRTTTGFKQWKGILFSSTPIPTGIYVEKMLLKQSLAELHLTKIGSDPYPLPDISHLCKDGAQTILYPPDVLDQPFTTVLSEKTGATEFTSLDTLLPGAFSGCSSTPVSSLDPVSSSAVMHRTVPIPGSVPKPSSVPEPNSVSVLSLAPVSISASIASSAPVSSSAPVLSSAPVSSSASVPSSAPVSSSVPVSSSAPVPGSAPVPSSAPAPSSAPCSEKNLFSDEYSIKYSIKYKVKELVDFYLSARIEDDLGPEQLLNLLKMDEDLGRGNMTLVWKYINKFYFQHLHKQ